MFDCVCLLCDSSGFFLLLTHNFFFIKTLVSSLSVSSHPRCRYRDIFSSKNTSVGVAVKPIRNVVVKLDYRNRDARSGALGDEVNAGIGLVF